MAWGLKYLLSTIQLNPILCEGPIRGRNVVKDIFQKVIKMKNMLQKTLVLVTRVI